MIKKRLAVFMIAVFIMSLPAIVNAQFANEVKLLAPDGVAGDFFGYSVSVNGDTVIVGARGGDDTVEPGSAYVFVRDPATGVWSQQQKLTASDGRKWDYFGQSVSISGDTAMVGAAESNATGAVYVFVRNPVTGVWTERQKLLASDSYLWDNFGVSVSISGDTAIIGADGDNGQVGSAYFFVRNLTTGDWTEQQKLFASDPKGSKFGGSVAIDGDMLIAGAMYDNDNGDYSGSAYVFVRDPVTGNWTEQQELLASDGAKDDHLGESVSISGDTAMVGAPWNNGINGTFSGSVYVFVRDPATGDWTEQQKLTASGSTLYLGVSVSISGDIAIAGAYGNFPNNDYSGSASIFVRDPATGDWTERQKLLASDAAAFDRFGYSVSISGNTAIAGSRQDDDNGADSGSAYVYTAPDITVTDSIGVNNDLQMPFGDVTVGTSSTVETATISNTGNADLNVSGIQLTGTDALEYTLDINGGANSCGSTTLIIAQGDNCTVTVTFSPASTGLKSANLTITSDDTDEATVIIALSGTGLPAVTNNPPDKPQLVSPTNGQQNLPTTVTLKWKPVTDPDGDPVTYDIYYCEDSDPFNNCTSVQAASLQEKTDKPFYAGFGYGGGMILFGIVFAAGFRDRKRIGLLAVMFILAGTLLISCGSSDSGNGSNDSNYKTYTVTGLNSGATYYWGVAAKDDSGGETQSDVWKFTTR